MNPKEALDNINNKILIQGRRNGKYLERGMMKVIVEALEKQVPKLAIWEGPYNDAKDDAEACCPNNECNYELDDDWSFCPKCGTSVVFYQHEVLSESLRNTLILTREKDGLRKNWRRKREDDE